MRVKVSRSLKVRTLSALLLMQLLSSAVLPIFKSAAEMTPETESSQVLENPEMESESIEKAPEETITEPIVEDSIEEVIIEEVPVEEVPNVEVPEVVPEVAPEEPAEIIETAPQMRTFSTFAATPTYKTVNYVATIFKGTNTIDSLPWGEPGFKQIGTTKNYVGTTVNVTKESANGAYGYVYLEGLGNGWIDLKAMKVLDVVALDYYDYVTGGNYEIDSLPWGTAGFQKLGNTSQLLGNQLYIRYKTTNGAYLYAEQNGKAIGWIDAKSFGLSGNKFTGIVSNGNYNVDSLPWGTPGFKKLSLTNKYRGIELSVLGSTQSGSYYLIALNGEKIGWVDKRAIVPFETKVVNYSNYIGSGSYNIDTLPWGTPGFKKMGTTSLILGRYVTITRESANGAYAYVNVEGVGQGWIDKKALGLKGSAHPAIIVKGSYNVDTLPWGTPGFTKIANTSAYVGSELEVRGTANDGSYSLVYQNGEFLGWIDSRALKPMSYKLVNYNLDVSGSQYEIDSLPWGDYGFKKVGTTASYVGLPLNISKESSNGAYLYASHAGKGLGWIDKKAFGFNSLSYSFYITNGQFNVDTSPWGTIGFQTVDLTKSLIGKELGVVAATQNGAYLKVAENGKVLGWIDARSGKKLNEKNVNYSAKISYSGNTIDSLPWGTPGFINTGATSNHLGKQVTITKESADGHYLFASELTGLALGWIDKKAFTFEKTVFIDVGHGGSDPGARYYGVNEKDINLQVSNKLKAELEAAGYRVIMSRTGDTFIDHKTERSVIANKSGADIFVSIHHNAMPGNAYVNGIETFFYEYEPDYPSKVNQSMHNNPDRLLKSAALANAIHDNLIKDTRAYDRTVKSTSFAVLRETALPAVLVELGFMSNQAELRKLTTDSYQSTLARAMKTGIDGYFRLY